MTATKTLKALAEAMDCPVILPGDSGYDFARRVWNADIVREPAAIVQCRSTQNVSAALTWCLENGWPITVRGGGHNLAGTSVADGHVMIDTGPMRSVSFEEEGRLVRVGAGCRWGDVDRAAEPHGVAVPAGVVSHTGVAGLTLGGGMGYLGRRFGRTVEHVVEIEVVVADGSIIRASRDNHPDLFWALKGAGHNFGIATEFLFRTVDLPELATVRLALYPAEARRDILRRFRDWAPGAPDNMGTYIRLYRAPEYWSQLPAAHRGRPIISVATVFYGDPAEEKAVTAPMFDLAAPIYGYVRTLPHLTLQHATDDEFRYGISHYWRNVAFREFPDEVIDTIIDRVDAYPGRSLNSSAFIAHQVMCPFELIAGKWKPRPSDDDSTAGMRSPWAGNIGADWEYPGERAPLVEWVKEFATRLGPWENGSYVNFTSEQLRAGATRDLYGAKYPRLLAAKRRYDPGNVFARGLLDLTEADAGGLAGSEADILA